MPPTKHIISELPVEHVMSLVGRRRIIGVHAMISHITLEKGCFVPLHHHPNEQFSYVLTGKLRFTFTDPKSPLPTTDSRLPSHFDIGPGETIHLPPNCPHAAEALEHTTVLDIFSPPSQTTGIDHAHKN